jgi:hypothetical protein
MVEGTSTSPPASEVETKAVGGPAQEPRATTAGRGRSYRRANSGSFQELRYGWDEVKVFPVNEYQLSLLGQNRGWAGLFFTLAGVLFGFGMNIWVSTDLSPNVPPVVLARWQIIQWASLGASVLCAIFGLAFLGFGHAVIRKIWKRTRFE